MNGSILALFALIIAAMGFAYASSGAFNTLFSGTINAQTNNGTVSTIITYFTENGLPANVVWDATYDNITNSSASPNGVSFSTLPGSYPFDIPNVKSGNVLYFSEPSNGYIIAGNTAQFYFSQNMTSISTSAPATSTSTIPTSTVSTASTSVTPSSSTTTIAAEFVNTTFSENGLPTNVVWGAVYDGVAQNSSVPGNIVFSSVPGGHSFSIANEIVNNTVYTPTPGYGNLTAGNTTEINFTAVSLTTTASTTTPITPPGPIKVRLGGHAVPVIVQNRHAPPIIVSGGVLKSISVNMNLNMNFNISIKVTSPPNPRFYKEIVISENTIVDPYVSSVEYNFSVPINYTVSHNISNVDITLFKNVSNGWQALPTTYTGTNSTYYFYSAVSNSLSTYAIGFTTNSITVQNSGSLSLSVGGSYRTYLWAGGSASFGTSPMAVVTCGSWSINATTIIDSELCDPSAMTPMANVTVIANSTSPSAKFSGDTNNGGEDNYTVLAGIGANVIMAYKAFEATTKTSPSVSFTTTAANSIVFLLFATSGGGSEIEGLTLPTGCQQQVLTTVASTYGSAAIANCSIETAGTYTASATWAGTTTFDTVSSAAIGFAPYSVTFDDSPSSGTITAGGQTYTNGQSSNIIGTNSVVANPPSSYQFAKWSASNSNITFGSTTSSSTTFTVEGNGIVTATYFKPSPVSITFNDSPTTGYMVVNGITETNGATGTLTTGTQYTANAIAPSGFNFVSWAFYPSANATISNSIAANTLITVYGTGTLKALFSPPAINLGVGFTANSATVQDAGSLPLSVGGSYRAYLWAGGSASFGTSPMAVVTCGSWSINATTIADYELCDPSIMTPMANVTVIANSTSPSAKFSGDTNNGGEVNYTVLGGIGANVIMAYRAFVASAKGSNSISFSTTESNSVVYLLFATSGGSSDITGLNLPSGCRQQILTTVSSTYGSAAIANCTIANAGAYSASATWAGTVVEASASAAAVGFAPYAVTLDDSPSSGTISVDNTQYSNGVVVPIIGTGSISASAPSGYTFNSWSTNSLSIVISNTFANPTSVTVEGNGSITALWNPPSEGCLISLSPSTITFGSLTPGSTYPTDIGVTDTNNGAVAANVLVSGGNWISGALSFGVSNTLWSRSSEVIYTGTALTASLSNTPIIVGAGGANSIYFGLGAPLATPAATYSQTITIENSC